VGAAAFVEPDFEQGSSCEPFFESPLKD